MSWIKNLYAEEIRLTVVDKYDTLRMTHSKRSTAKLSIAERSEAEQSQAKQSQGKLPNGSTIGTCPKCGPATPLVVRTRRSNQHQFLGCSNYPDCSYTTQIPVEIKMRLEGQPELFPGETA